MYIKLKDNRETEITRLDWKEIPSERRREEEVLKTLKKMKSEKSVDLKDIAIETLKNRKER